MQQEMYRNPSKGSRCNVVEHDPGALWESLQLPHRRRLDDIERSKKYKTNEESLPREGNGDEGDELPGDFVDDDALGVLTAGGSGDAGGGGDTDKDGKYGE